MKKIHLIIIKKPIFQFIILPFLFFTLICISIFYIQGIETAIKVSSSSNNDDFSLSTPSSKGGKLAIIIDDFGSNRDGVKEMMSIGKHLTFAVMPFLAYSKSDAQEAHEKGYEVIVHLPMESNYGKVSWLGPMPILVGMSSDNVKRIVRDSFESVPYAVGANIHMGSKASSNESIMSSVLDVIKEKGLYFVDSRTADRPIGKKIADAKGVPCYDRDIFLDGQKPKSFVKKRLEEAGKITLKKGKAIAIGHVGIEGGKVTAEAISEMLPEFDRKNIQLVFVSELGE
ncbi:MAG: divergent polysaccharide deacetylase family protein [Firmicutes bacterium]|nr:divergent polysaccharide deacetylase family protein [Bacillota bacterium]